ncbi:MAG: hypothetical protein QOH31_5599 [Verrucomicrobiota bacterium]|jgi:hypothetical protein
MVTAVFNSINGATPGPIAKVDFVLLFVSKRTKIAIARPIHLSSARRPTVNGKCSAADPGGRRWPHESHTFRELLLQGELKRSKGKHL